MSREDCIKTVVAYDKKVDSPQEAALKMKLIGVLRTTVELEDGFVDFSPLALEGFEFEASPEAIRCLLDGASQLAEINQKATKKSDESEQYGAIGRHITALAALYAEPPATKRKGPNNPFSMPGEQGASLSRVGDSMRHRSGRGR